MARLPRAPKGPQIVAVRGPTPNHAMQRTLDRGDMARFATTFSEFVDLAATNDPHGTILSWWRRVDRAVDDLYAARFNPRPKLAAEIERDLRAAPNLGAEGMELFRRLRRQRNRVAHGDVGSLSRQDAVAFAQEAHRLGWAIGVGMRLSDIEVLPVDETAV